VTVECVLADRIPAGADLIIANPPYMIDPAQRSYRDGGALLGGAVSLDWARQALAALVPGGTLLLYTGAAFIDGRAPLIDQLTHACAGAGASLVLSEIDPDVFGDELGSDAYHGVERIAAIDAVITSAR
jgi:release factor glutamine methyltransferase